MPLCIKVEMIGLAPLATIIGTMQTLTLAKLRKRVEDLLLSHGNSMLQAQVAVQTQIVHGLHIQLREKATKMVVAPVDLTLGTIGKNICQRTGTRRIPTVEKLITQVSVSQQMLVKMQMREC